MSIFHFLLFTHTYTTSDVYTEIVYMLMPYYTIRYSYSFRFHLFSCFVKRSKFASHYKIITQSDLMTRLPSYNSIFSYFFCLHTYSLLFFDFQNIKNYFIMINRRHQSEPKISMKIPRYTERVGGKKI